MIYQVIRHKEKATRITLKKQNNIYYLSENDNDTFVLNNDIKSVNISVITREDTE